MSQKRKASTAGEPPKASKHGRGRSADLGDVVFKYKELDIVKKDLTAMKEKLEGDAHLCVQALEPALENITEVLQSLDYLAAYSSKPENAGVTISALSFSKLTDKHLLQLGVLTQRKLSVDHIFMPRIEAILASEIGICTSIHDFWDKRGSKLAESFKGIARTTSLVAEAGRRFLIDCVIQEVITFATSVSVFAYLYPEITISSRSKTPASISSMVNQKNKQVKHQTFLTGTVDYLAVGIGPLDTKGMAYEEDNKRATNTKELLSKPNLAALLDYLAPFNSKHSLPTVKLLHVEAKRKDTSKTLEAQIPQAIGETLATMSIGQKVRGVWCLTTGDKWIFGYLQKVNELPGGIESVIVDPMEVEIDSHNTEALLRRVFFTLVCCVCALFLYWDGIL